jgi:hypothetical protein
MKSKRIPAPTLILRHINGLPFGQLFCTRDFLNYGPRDSVDQCMYRLVRDKVVFRVARGVFVRLKPGTPIPTAEQIVEAKTKAFGRKLHKHGRNALKHILKRTSEQHPHVFATDGATTSFRSIHGTILLVRYAPRKLSLKDAAHGLVVRGFWSAGKGNITQKMFDVVIEGLGRKEKHDLRRSCHIMPAWLADIIVWGKTAPEPDHLMGEIPSTYGDSKRSWQ